MARVDVLGQLTSDEILIIQAIEAGTYFIEGGVPTGVINDANVTFTLAGTPAPAASLAVYVNGQRMKITEDYTLSGNTLTMDVAPQVGDILQVDYRVDPT
ncbi:hypothetical protein LCGC14_3093700 [marine sediment metagenome]|uniref:DUF4183 domain-containing protein n=1 Tax=marine sediment metagenome TaxID=412755 RepID=A0A0F8WAA3_9ZZZZ|nr:hypothetical protein [Candidatus Scalindua sp.]